MKSGLRGLNETIGRIDIEALGAANFQDLKQRKALRNVLQESLVDKNNGRQRQRRQESKRQRLIWLKNGLQTHILGSFVFVCEVDIEGLEVGECK